MMRTESETNNQNGNFTKKYSDEGIDMPPYASTDMSRDKTPDNGEDQVDGGLVLAQRELPWKSKSNEVQADPGKSIPNRTRYRSTSSVKSSDSLKLLNS